MRNYKLTAISMFAFMALAFACPLLAHAEELSKAEQEFRAQDPNHPTVDVDPEKVQDQKSGTEANITSPTDRDCPICAKNAARGDAECTGLHDGPCIHPTGEAAAKTVPSGPAKKVK